MQSEWLTHKGKKIFYTNLSNLDNAALKIELDQVEKIVVAQPLHSMATVVDLRGTRINATAMVLFRNFADRTRGYGTKIAAILTSTTPVMQYLFDQITAFIADSDMRLFDNLEQAKDWLVKE